MNSRQRKFAEAFTGNATEAARKAGYRGDNVSLANTARKLLRHPEISSLIREREKQEIDSLVASRKDRLLFWSNVMNNTEYPLADRLRASELLGKAQLDFTERHEVVGAVVPTEQLVVMMKARLEHEQQKP